MDEEEYKEWLDSEDDVDDGYQDSPVYREESERRRHGDVVSIQSVETFIRNADDDYQINMPAAMIRELLQRSFNRGAFAGIVIGAIVVGFIWACYTR